MAKERERPAVRKALTVLVVAGGLVTGAVALDRFLDPFNGRPFDAAVWAAACPQERGPMARDAIRHLPPGLPADRVRQLLGEPQPVPGRHGSVDGFGNRLRHAATWSYWVGGWCSYGLDSAFLYVHFGPNGTVVEAEITGG